MERCTELLNSNKLQESPENRRVLFNNPNYKPYLLITYNQFRQLFEIDDNDGVTRLNKMIIYTEMDYYNYVYNQVWPYKWYPLVCKFAYNCVRMRQTSVVFTLLYLYSVEYFLEKFCLFQYVDDKIIDVSEYFTASLARPKNLQKQNELFQKYKQMLMQDFKDKHYVEEYKPRDWILMGNKFNIHNPYIHWTETQDKNANQVLKEFFIKNSQILLVFDKVSRLTNLIKKEGYIGMQRESRAAVQNFFKQCKRMVLEFPIYKQYIPYLRGYYQIESLLSAPYVDQRKRFIQLDHYKLIGSKVLNLFNYIAQGKCEFVRYEFKWFDPNISAKKPQLKVESVWYDFVPYAAFCLIPVKFFGFKKTLSSLKQYSNYAASITGRTKQQTII